VGKPGLEDKPDQPRRSLVLSTLLLSSPFWGALMSRMVCWGRTMTGQDCMWILGQDSMRLPSWDDMLLMGQDNMRLLGQENMRLPSQDEMGWDEMGHDKMWMMG